MAEPGGQTETITSLAATTAATVPRSSRSEARARRRLASLRPADGHTTRMPPARRHAPTTEPISPGCSSPTVLAILSLLPFAGPNRPAVATLACVCRGARAPLIDPGAGHGFFADYRPSYNPAAAADGWKRCLATHT